MKIKANIEFDREDFWYIRGILDRLSIDRKVVDMIYDTVEE